MSEKTYTERLNVAGDQALRVVKRVVREGNVRRLIIRNERGQVLMQVPLTVGVVGVVIAPLAAAVGAVVTMVSHCTIEIERCGEPIGKQDQYGAAYGGFNFIEFNPDDSVSVEPILCRRETIEASQRGIVTFYTGITRSASAILKDQQQVVANEKVKQKVMLRMVQLARDLKAELQRNNLTAFGEIIHEGWRLKKSLTGGITTDQIDAWYEKARRAGAVGGKLLGAGTGGFTPGTGGGLSNRFGLLPGATTGATGTRRAPTTFPQNRNNTQLAPTGR